MCIRDSACRLAGSLALAAAALFHGLFQSLDVYKRQQLYCIINYIVHYMDGATGNIHNNIVSVVFVLMNHYISPYLSAVLLQGALSYERKRSPTIRDHRGSFGFLILA